MVCLIDFDKSQDLAVQTATTLQPMINGKTALIAISGDENPDLILNAMRAGCSEYLTKPLQADAAVKFLAKIARTLAVCVPACGQTNGRILAFLSVRGGAGATTVAVHLGTFLAKRHAQKMLIVDLHPHLGHVAMLLGIDSRNYNFHELLRNIARLDLTLLNSYVGHHSSGVDVLLSPDSLSESSVISCDALERAIRFLAEVYDYVLIDCTGGLDELNQTTIALLQRTFPGGDSGGSRLARSGPLRGPLAGGLCAAGKTESCDQSAWFQPNRDGGADREGDPASRGRSPCPPVPRELIRAVDTGEPISPEKRSEFASQIKNWASTLASGKGWPNRNQTQICVLELTLSGKKTLEDRCHGRFGFEPLRSASAADRAEGPCSADALQRSAGL